MATEPDDEPFASPDGGPPPAGPVPAGRPDAWPGAVDAATRGLDAVLGREVAMVTLPPARGDDLLVRTEQVRRLAALHHAHLVEVFDVDGLTEGSESTLVLQSVAGRVLEPDADLGRWAPISVAEVGAQVASALAHAHGRGVVHGGIGPASLVLGGTPGAPYAWLTGFTAALHPAPPSMPESPESAVAPEAPLPSRPDDDVADLGRALAVVLDPEAPAAPALQQALADMVHGRVGARGAAEALARVAEILRHVDEDETSFVPVALPVQAPASSPTPGPTEVVAAPRPPSEPVAVVPATRSRRRRMAGRGVHFATLGGAALALAAASGFVLWSGHGPGTPQEVGVSDLTTPAGPNPAPVAVPPAGSSSSTTDETVSDDDEDDGTTERDTTTRSPITSDITTAPGPTSLPVPPPLPPTVPPTTVSPTTVPTVPTTEPTTGPTDPTGPTTGPTTTTTRPGGARGATLAAP